MKTKKLRQGQVAKILEKEFVVTQHQLQKLLARAGYRVTQATLSRDMKELGVIYAPAPHGPYYYKISTVQTGPLIQQDLQNRFSKYVVNISRTDNLILIKTLPGEASGMARLIDELSANGTKQTEVKEILGTVAGDDTILVIMKNKVNIPKIIKFLKGTTP